MMKRNATIDYLRGLAAVMVCCCHFRHALPPGLQGVAERGDLGVQVFFVISGYIIPYSMERGGYAISTFGRFWLKRFFRLQPTFVVAVLLTFFLSQAAAHFKGSISEFPTARMGSALLYLWTPPEDPVIWTLIVELQYYLFISLAFPLLFSDRPIVRRASFGAALVLGAWLAPDLSVLKYLPYFLVGFAVCYSKTRRSDISEAILLATLALDSAVFQSSVSQIAAGLVAATAILYMPTIQWRLGAFLGAISYSLYLIHFPLGVKLINVALPHVPSAFHWVLLPTTTILCCAVAYVLFKCVEEPSSRWAQQVSLKKPSPSAPVVATPERAGQGVTS
jgi:peptidoglycan/LPS O-acetylase OafA/YrhL